MAEGGWEMGDYERAVPLLLFTDIPHPTSAIRYAFKN
jgi:hypothetical protein